MGARGTRNGMKKEISGTIEKEKANACSEHRRLCVKAGEWLKNNDGKMAPRCTYVAVELVTATAETPDVFGWNYWTSVIIEVKTSRSDFLADKKKSFRILPDYGIGEYRYYCCPAGLIKEHELPESWGLIYEVGGKLEVVRRASRQPANYRAELTLCTSILRREGIKPQVFDYRKDNEL